MILFVTDSSGNVVDFKAGLDGEVAPNDSTFSESMPTIATPRA